MADPQIVAILAISEVLQEISKKLDAVIEAIDDLTNTIEDKEDK